jgi:FecR protein
MKRFFAKTFSGGPIALCSIFLSLVAAGPVASGAPLQQARVSQVIQDVRLLEPHATSRPAAVNDKVTLGRAVRTGVESRAELTFTDLTITRLGANTIFSLTAGAREIDLTNGTILVQVPAKAAPVKINTASVTVGITGGTALLSTGPPLKFMVLEGVGTIYPKGHPEKAVTAHGGEMVLMTADGRFTLPQQFDVSLVLATSHLIIDFPPLTNLPLILVVMNQQIAEQQLAGTTSQLLVKNLIDVIDVTDQNANANPVVLASTSAPTPPPPPPTPTPPPPTPTPPPPTPTPPPPTPTPTPSKFGPPSVITSPVPYVITSGTVITTDPSITTNGVTDFGKIWRGSAIDGAFSIWAFGSTSAFDTALGIDNFFADPNHFPIAAFKFQSLSLNGNPIIDASNGGVTKLALIGVDGITSGPPGGTLTFSGLDMLALGTVNGSINLTSDISFQDISVLAMYARGAGSDLTIDSPISNIGSLYLAAEGSIRLANPGTMSVGVFDATAGDDLTLQIGGSLLLNGRVRLNTLVLPGTTVASGANLTVNITGDYTNSSATEFSRLRVTNEGAHIGTGGNINVSIGGDLTTTGTAGDFALVVRNTNGQIDIGGNITLMVDGSVSTQGQLSLLVENYDFSANPAGHIGTGGNIFVMTGGDLTADSISAVVNNRNGGTIASGGNLTFNIGGALTTLHDGTDYFGETESLALNVSNRYDNTLGSSIGGDATLFFHADSASIGGILSVIVSDVGGTIDGNALLNFSVTHDMTVEGADHTNSPGDDAATWLITNNDGPNVGSPIGGTIHGNATLLLSATNLTVPGGSLLVDIFNQNSGVTGPGGRIDSSANITFNLSGNLTTQADASFAILNNYTATGPGGIGGIGGTIGQDAVINVNANSLSIGGGLDTSINNGRNAGDNGGTIGGNGTINVNAASISTGLDAFGSSLDGLINNATGSIGGDAIVNVDVTQAITAQGPANFQILNNDGGDIGGNANILVTAGGDFTANSIFAFINNHNTGSIGSGANLTFNIGGALVTQGDATFVISNLNEGPGGGTIGSLASVDINAASISVGGFFQTFAGANGGGSITGSASNLVNATGNLVVQGPIAVQIEDTGFIQINPIIFIAGGHIGGDATVTLAAQNITTSSMATGIPGTDVMALEASIYSNGSGTIGGNAIVNVTASQNISAPGTVFFTVANGNYQGFGPGTIGGDAQINLSASNFSSGTLFDDIYNYGGASIGGNAVINITAGTLSVSGDLNARIDNSSGGSIGASSEGGATINMNVSGSATVTNNATVAIYGSDGATFAAINFNGGINGGSYGVGGTFLSSIDGNGTITFNNASVHANVLQVGALGTNGVLNIGGGTLSADTTLKLYAGGSNGTLNFSSSVTLSSGTAMHLAANTITIQPSVLVTIAGAGGMANIYTTNANYSGFGGTNPSNGTFGGNGANTPQPLANAPLFNDPPATPTTTTGTTSAKVKPPTLSAGSATTTTKVSSTILSSNKTISAKTTGTTINVSSTAELLSLLDGASVGPDGKATISGSKSTSNLKNLSGTNINGLSRAQHRVLIQQMHDRDTTRLGGKRIL